MNEAGSSKNLIRIRLVAEAGSVQHLAGEIVNLLEKNHYEVMEWSSPYPCDAPDGDKKRVYLTAVKKGANEA
jgi:hypothetical protein